MDGFTTAMLVSGGIAAATQLFSGGGGESNLTGKVWNLNEPAMRQFIEQAMRPVEEQPGFGLTMGGIDRAYGNAEANVRRAMGGSHPYGSGLEEGKMRNLELSKSRDKAKAVGELEAGRYENLGRALGYGGNMLNTAGNIDNQSYLRQSQTGGQWGQGMGNLAQMYLLSKNFGKESASGGGGSPIMTGAASLAPSLNQAADQRPAGAQQTDVMPASMQSRDVQAQQTTAQPIVARMAGGSPVLNQDQGIRNLGGAGSPAVGPYFSTPNPGTPSTPAFSASAPTTTMTPGTPAASTSFPSLPSNIGNYAGPALMALGGLIPGLAPILGPLGFYLTSKTGGQGNNGGVQQGAQSMGGLVGANPAAVGLGGMAAPGLGGMAAQSPGGVENSGFGSPGAYEDRRPQSMSKNRKRR